MQSSQPGEDGHRLRPRQDAQADEDARVVVDETHDPDLGVLAPGTLEEERTLDVDVPQLVGPEPFIGRAVLPPDRRSTRAEIGQQPVDRVVAEGEDVPPGELGRQPLAVPVGQQAGDDDRLLASTPAGDPAPGRVGGPERLDATLGIPAAPAVEARPADAQGEGGPDAATGRSARVRPAIPWPPLSRHTALSAARSSPPPRSSRPSAQAAERACPPGHDLDSPSASDDIPERRARALHPVNRSPPERVRAVSLGAGARLQGRVERAHERRDDAVDEVALRVRLAQEPGLP